MLKGLTCWFDNNVSTHSLGDSAPQRGKKSGPKQGNFNRKQNPRFKNKHENLKKGRLIIRNLPFKTTEESLTNELAKYGAITELNILKKPDGKLVGCAFAQYEKYPDSLNAIKNMNAKDFLGRKLTVDFAVSKDRYKAAHPTTEEPEVKAEEEDEKPEIKEEVKEEVLKEEKQLDSDDSGNEGSDDEADEDEIDEKEKVVEEFKKQRSKEEDHEFTIFVKNLSFDTTNEDLHECFKKYGPIKYALVVKDQVSGHSKGTGFVRFFKRESVNMCLQQTGLISLQNYTLEIFPSLSREKVKSLDTDKNKQEPKDSRNMYLLREGMVLAGSSAAEGVSATDMSTRLRLEQIKSSMLKNLNRFISRDRLTIHNIPETYDDEKMRKMVISRTSVKPIECRVMRENNPSPTHPKGKPKGFGFLSFKKHEDALNVLRKLNNNPDIFSANHRPILAFSIEDKNVLNIKERRTERSKLNNPTYQKKQETLKIKKKAKKLEKKNKTDKKDKKPVAKAAPAPTVDNPEETEDFSGFAAKPGAFVKLRGTFRLKEQSKIHEKSMKDRNKKVKREKQNAEIRQEKDDKKQDRQPKKRKIDEGTQDSLSKMIDKYKNMIKGNDGASEEKKLKTRGKWFMD